MPPFIKIEISDGKVDVSFSFRDKPKSVVDTAPLLLENPSGDIPLLPCRVCGVPGRNPCHVCGTVS